MPISLLNVKSSGKVQKTDSDGLRAIPVPGGFANLDPSMVLQRDEHWQDCYRFPKLYVKL
jgi:hypothetical protein